VAEKCQQLLDQLEDGELHSIAVWKLKRHTNTEIAALLGWAVPTVERRRRLIRKCWEGEQGI
jgi:hypothetical protein